MIRQPTPYPYVAEPLYSEYLDPRLAQAGNAANASRVVADTAQHNRLPGLPFGSAWSGRDAISVWISLRPWTPKTVRQNPTYKTGDVYLRNLYGG